MERRRLPSSSISFSCLALSWASTSFVRFNCSSASSKVRGGQRGWHRARGRRQGFQQFVKFTLRFPKVPWRGCGSNSSETSGCCGHPERQQHALKVINPDQHTFLISYQWWRRRQGQTKSFFLPRNQHLSQAIPTCKRRWSEWCMFLICFLS